MLDSTRWSIIMFKNYLKTAVRLFTRDMGYSLLKLSGGHWLGLFRPPS